MIRTLFTAWVATLALAIQAQGATLIRGDVGNKPLDDPGWPIGAASLVNHTGRIAWWEGPPFGGGQWHSECRGNAQALNAVLANFAKLDLKVKRVVVHDGAGHSFWIAPNREPEKFKEARIDWSLMVWESKNWEQLKKMPADFNPIDVSETSPPSQIDVYTAELRWSEVTVPPGIEVVDKRLEAHGFTHEDGIVLEGTVKAVSTDQPLAARVKVERLVPKEQGGYDYPLVAETQADAQGRWVLKKVPAGWFQVVIEASGFVPRIAGYVRLDEQPCWQSFQASLSPAVSVSGRVIDEKGQPLKDATVRLDNVEPKTGGRYETPSGYTAQTNADGRFQTNHVPEGSASVWVTKPGYIIPGLGRSIKTPASNLEFQMIRSASLLVTVDFQGKDRPEGYIIQMAPVGGEVIGSYGGSGNINAQQQMKFESIPPGAYVVRGRPNPGSVDQETEPVTVELKGGQAAEVTLRAK